MVFNVLEHFQNIFITPRRDPLPLSNLPSCSTFVNFYFEIITDSGSCRIVQRALCDLSNILYNYYSIKMIKLTLVQYCFQFSPFFTCICVYFCATLSHVQLHVNITTVKMQNSSITPKDLLCATRLYLLPYRVPLPQQSLICFPLLQFRYFKKQNPIVCNLQTVTFFIKHNAISFLLNY